MECLNCGHEIQGSKVKKFCNSSCSATYNNKKRRLSDETKQKIFEKLTKDSKNEEIRDLALKGLTVSEIVELTGCTKTTVYKWINHYRITIAESTKDGKTIYNQPKSKLDKTGYYCYECGVDEPDKFYGKKKSICAKCHNQYTIALGKEKRLHAVELLGGKCVGCGYNEHTCSLDIHHSDPSIKDDKFSAMRGWSIKRIENEIRSCVLLCRNCHSAYHNGVLPIDEEINEAVKKNTWK